MNTHSIHESGGKGIVITAETSRTNGLPTIVLVGFAGKSLDESRERVRSAFSASTVSLPKKRSVCMKMIKIAQTISDLDGTTSISKNHIVEALQYRPITKD